MHTLKDGTMLELQTFEIYEKPYSLNEFRNEHHYRLNTIKTFWNVVVKNTLMINNVKPVKRANIEFQFFFKNNIRRDADNMSATVKFILDAMVISKILPDDNFSVVEKLQITKGEMKRDCIKVFLWGEIA